MINFFRKIRLSHLSSKQFSQYLVYALGEIILVVIGILIALQVSNWNETRKERRFELKLLTEIYKSLNDDLSYLEKGLRPRVDQKMEAIQNLLKMRQYNRAYTDSTILALYNQANMGLSVENNNGAYETIKSVGLDKISNDTIRTLLTRVYDMDIPRILDIIKANDDNPSMAIEKTRLHNNLWKRIQVQLPDDSWKIVSVPREEDILRKGDFIDRIKIEQDNANVYYFWIEIYENTLRSAIALIEKELSLIES